MTLGDHGRKVLYPMTISQKFYSFPWKRYYQNSLYFRYVCGCATFVGATWAYVLLRGNTFQFIVIFFHLN